MKLIETSFLNFLRDKLEQVCREQQKLMKSIKSESMSKIRDEEEKRKETQAHFQKSINEILSTLGKWHFLLKASSTIFSNGIYFHFANLGKNNDENLKIKEANSEMTKKFKYLAEQYELREKQLEKLNEQIKLETQLNEAKLAKVQMESTIEKEILLKEKQAALEEILATKKAVAEMETRERLLKEQLNIYTEKYSEFQTSLQRSNDTFGTYKTELEKMSKRIKSLEKESYEWRVKYEKSNRALLNMVSEKQVQDEYVAKSSRQLAQLQKLCRTLQAERTVLLNVLKENNIERPPMPELPPEPTDVQTAPPPSMDKLEKMSRNCKELKETLAQLQGQMNAITAEKNSKPKSAETEKKPKAKKNKVKNANKNDAAKVNGGPEKEENQPNEADLTGEEKPAEETSEQTPTAEINGDVNTDETTKEQNEASEPPKSDVPIDTANSNNVTVQDPEPSNTVVQTESPIEA